MTPSMDAQQIYDNFHGRAAGTGGLRAAQQAVEELAGRYSEAAESVRGVVDHVRSGWQGTAAEAALRGLVPLAEDSLLVSRQLDTAQDLIARQIDSFHTAAAEVRPVPPEPNPQDVVRLALSGQDPQPMVDRLRAYQAAQQANVDAYAKYRAASEYNTTNLPPLSPSLPPERTRISVTPAGRPVSGAPSTPATARDTALDTDTAADRTVSGQNPRGPVTGQPSGATLRPDTGSATGPVPDRGGTAEGPVPARTGSAEPGEPVPAGDVTRTEESVDPVTDPISGLGVDRTTRNAGQVVDGSTDGGVGRLPAPPAGRLTGRATGRSRTEPPSGRTGPPEREVPPGGRVVERGTVGNGVLTEPAAEGPSPAVGPGTGGRRGEEDREHRTRFVLAEDGETRFGPDEKVAPRVIGE